MTNGNGLASVDHVVVLMLENRSFDHMLGFLYPGNVSPSGQPFDGLTGTETARRRDGLAPGGDPGRADRPAAPGRPVTRYAATRYAAGLTPAPVCS